jgi:acyl-CoA synthetase (AMP-forming)/AMP-acid ligase II
MFAVTNSLLEQIRGFGDAEAVVIDDDVTLYSDLAKLVERWQCDLDDHGVPTGAVVTIEGPYSPQMCAGLIALMARGVIVVPLTALPETKRGEYRDTAEVEITIEVPPDRPWRLEWTGRRATHELYERLREEDRPGLVLFSSGTTGRSKASVLDLTKALARYTGPGRPRRTLAFLNLDHIGGINTLLHTLTYGGAIVTVSERSAETVFAAIATHRVEVLPTTPTFLNMVLISGAHEQHDTSSLQMVTYGTEPMPPRILQRLAEVLPHVRLKQTYGLSELGILPTRSRDDRSLWVRLGGSGFDYKIVDGILWVRSEMAMLGYLNAPAPFDDEGYFNTQDVVEVDGDDVRILGRRSEIINVGGEKVFPSEVEAVILEAPNVADVTVSGRPNHVTGMVVQATVRLVSDEDPSEVNRRIQKHCSVRLEQFKVPALVHVSSRDQHSDRFKKVRSV